MNIHEENGAHSNFFSMCYTSVYICLCSRIFWILMILPFTGPLLYGLICYSGSFTLTVCAKFFGKHERYENYHVDYSAFYRIRKMIATIIDFIGSLWHGYEVVGLEKIIANAKDGALVIFYHGGIPIDSLYLLSKFFCEDFVKFRTYTAEFMFKIPGWDPGMRIAHMFTGTRQDMVRILKDRNVVLLLPGGVSEAIFGNNKYEVQWKNRTGFAKVATEAKVPIIPAFTENIREAFGVITLPKNWTQKLYQRTKLPLAIFHGILPVKLRTIIGDPIPYDPNLTPEQLAEKAMTELQRLIQKHQRIPGSISKALLDRVWDDRKLKDI